jgi:hypothetical protein
MKKVMLSVAVVAAFAFASCSGGPSVCDCINEKEGVDKDKCKEMEKKWKEDYDKADDKKKEEMEKEYDSCKEKKEDKK